MLNKVESYLLGLFQTDGHFIKRGSYRRIGIELSNKDVDILHKINAYFNDKCHLYTRTRDTNFAQNYTSSTLSITDKPFINKIEPFIPYGKKSLLIGAPKEIKYCEKDYWRGVIDGDGSLGIKKINKHAYVSIVSASDQLYYDYKSFLKTTYDIDVNISKNKRDSVYNVVLLKYKAYVIVKDLYTNSVMSIDRKQTFANQIINFDYQKNSYNGAKTFTKEEDEFLLRLTVNQLKRTPIEDIPTSITNLGSVISRKKYLDRLVEYGVISRPKP